MKNNEVLHNMFAHLKLRWKISDFNTFMGGFNIFN